MNQFTKRGFVVTAVHIGVITLMLVSTELSRLFLREDHIHPIDFTVAIPDLGQSQEKEPKVQQVKPAPAPAKPEPVKAPDPTPTPEVKPEPPKDSTPAVSVVEEKPKWTPKPPDEIKIGPKVTRKAPKLPPPTMSEKSPLTAAQIQKLLDMGARADVKTSIPEGDALFMAIIQNAFEGAWDEPSATVADGRYVDTEINFSTDGRVIGHMITKRSGVPELDQSVDAALACIDHVSGIPSTFFECHNGRITIRFRVKE